MKIYILNNLVYIKNIEVNDDRKVSRAKRLSLNPNFKGLDSIYN